MAEKLATPEPERKIPQDDYLKKEYDKLNKEIEKLLDETRSREKYGLTILAGVATWIYTELTKPHASVPLTIKFVGCIPVVIIAIYGVSVYYLYQNIKWIGQYLSTIEEHFLTGYVDGLGRTFGWEAYFNREGRKRKFVTVTYCSWIVQVILSIILAIFVLSHD